MRPGSDLTRGRRLGFGLVCMMMVAATSQAWKQVVQAGEINDRAKATKRFVVKTKEYPKRGAIMSADGRILAQSDDSYVLGINFEKVPKSDSFFLALGQASKIPAIEFSGPARNGSKSRQWAEVISAQRAKAIELVQTHWYADGISLARVQKRQYPFGEAFESVVGTFAPAAKPTGLESSKNSLLTGVEGEREGMMDRRREYLPMRMTENDLRAIDGQDITVTLDSQLQMAAQASVKSAVISNNADQGMAVVLEPKSGRILAIVSYVLGQEAAGSNGYNPAVMGVFEPGSIFKVFTLALAMDEGKVKLDDTVHCTGSMGIGRRARIHCTHTHGTVDARGAISKSCNVAAAQWAAKIGHDRFTEFFHESGLLDQPGIGLPKEAKGSYLDDNGNLPLNLANFGFGQSTAFSPLGLATVLNALASDGTYCPPRLVDKIGGRLEPAAKKTELFSPGTSAQVLDLMRSTFESEGGTAHSLRIPGYTLGGKTGTAQKLSKKYADGKRRYVSNFVGFVPGDRPVATVLIMIDNPKAGKYYGGSVAGPVFQDIARAVIKRYNLPKSK